MLDDIDFLDFVPIENNANDFDLGDIIEKLDAEDKEKKQIVAGGNQIAPNVNANQVPNMPESAMMANNYIQNVTNNQRFPLLPRNVFHNSNVTINYNFK